MSGPEQYRLVLVEWVDSHGCSTDWRNMDKVNVSLTTCYSAGYLVAETEDALVIVPHVAFGESLFSKKGQGCGDMTIPRVAVRSVSELTKAVPPEARA